MDSKKEYKKVYAIVEIGGEVKAVYEDEDTAIKVVHNWNERCERGKTPQWMVYYVETNYFEKGY